MTLRTRILLEYVMLLSYKCLRRHLVSLGITNIISEASCGAGDKRDCKRGRFCVRFSQEKMKYLKCTFFRSGIGAKSI